MPHVGTEHMAGRRTREGLALDTLYGPECSAQPGSHPTAATRECPKYWWWAISAHTIFPSSSLRSFWADSKCNEASLWAGPNL